MSFIVTKHSACYEGAPPFNPLPDTRLCRKMVSRKISYAREGAFFPSPSVSSLFLLLLHECEQGYIFIGYYMHIILPCIRFTRPLHDASFSYSTALRNLTSLPISFSFYCSPSLLNPLAAPRTKLKFPKMASTSVPTVYSRGKYNVAQLVPEIETLFRVFLPFTASLHLPLMPQEITNEYVTLLPRFESISKFTSKQMNLLSFQLFFLLLRFACGRGPRGMSSRRNVRI